MKNLDKLRTDIHLVRKFAIIGLIVGFLYAIIEHLIRIKLEDPAAMLPLLIRGPLVGTLIASSAAIFDIVYKQKFNQKPFWYLVVVRSLAYSLIITFWLSVINGGWIAIDEKVPITKGLEHYYGDPTFPINLVTVFVAVVIIVGLSQVNSLHRKGELLNFILGKYHRPQEVDRIFCFVDLKGSTTLAEQLGNIKFGSFLKDFYSDITDAIKRTNAEIYQYVGDEIILAWTYEKGLQENRSIQCYFMMRKIIEELKPKYLKKYDSYPQFKAGLHAGKVLVTWVGELKKEILYIGDVVNTTSRIQEDCKRLNRDCLISQDLLEKHDDLGQVKASFVDETIPRGKGEKVRLYCLELA